MLLSILHRKGKIYHLLGITGKLVRGSYPSEMPLIPLFVITSLILGEVTGIKAISHLSFSSTSGGQLIICIGFISIFEVATALPSLTVFMAWTFIPLTSMFI